MVMHIHCDWLEEKISDERKSRGIEGFDEIWEGVYVIYEPKDDEHQDLLSGLSSIILMAKGFDAPGHVYAGINVSNRIEDGMSNIRIPDVAYYAPDTTAQNHHDFYFGGPDFAVEVISEGDRTREKFDFYAKVNTRELLLVDRDPWALELYRLQDGQLQLVGKSTPEQSDELKSEVIPLSFRLQPGDDRPRIAVVHHDGEQSWLI